MLNRIYYIKLSQDKYQKDPIVLSLPSSMVVYISMSICLSICIDVDFGGQLGREFPPPYLRNARTFISSTTFFLPPIFWFPPIFLTSLRQCLYVCLYVCIISVYLSRYGYLILHLSIKIVCLSVYYSTHRWRQLQLKGRLNQMAVSRIRPPFFCTYFVSMSLFLPPVSRCKSYLSESLFPLV